MGYDSKEGVYNSKHVSNDEMWKSVNWLFSSKSVNETSYKFIFFKALIDSFSLGNKLSFEQVFTRFTEISWNIVLKYGISQKGATVDHRNSVLEQVFHEYSEISLEGEFFPWNEIEDNDKNRICKKVKNSCKRYVVGAMFSDMNELFYSFDKREEWIELNPVMVRFINGNREIIENLNYYKWAKFYSSINTKETEGKLHSLIDNSFARKNESLYRSMLAYEFESSNEVNVIEDAPNTIEILLRAEMDVTSDVDSFLNEHSEEDYEEEMYDSYDKMRIYLNNPILLINYMKKKRINGVV